LKKILLGLVLAAGPWLAKAETALDAKAIVDADGSVHLPALTVPYSSLASEESRKNFLEFTSAFARLLAEAGSAENSDDPAVIRKKVDDVLIRPGAERLRAAFAVTITPQTIAGIQTDVVTPEGGVSAQNNKRVLINLHGGGSGRYGGQQQSIPIASLGRIKVIAVDYEDLAPTFRFPVASEEVSDVYRELLKTYKPQNIGIYGCSLGGYLTAQSVAWFQTHGLPRPGAIGLFGSSGFARIAGDSDLIGHPLGGLGVTDPKSIGSPGSDYFIGANLDDPMVSPAGDPTVLKKFPPTLLISGTRDFLLSGTVYTHAQLVKAGVDAELHVWEGAMHCSFAEPVVDPNVPETRETWDVIVSFFDRHLGRR
jgi:monoterpene epsilon-lactone hydrolase